MKRITHETFLGNADLYRPDPNYDENHTAFLSPDGRTLITREEVDGKLCIKTNNHPQYFDEVDFDGLAFSRDGAHLAYAIRKGDSWSVVIDGEIGPSYDQVALALIDWELISHGINFSPDNRRVAYTASRDGKWFVVVGNTEGKPYDSISRGNIGTFREYTYFTPDSQHIIYIAQSGQHCYVVFDGQEIGPYAEVQFIKYRVDDNESVIYYNYRESEGEKLKTNYLGGFPPWRRIPHEPLSVWEGKIVWSPDGKRKAQLVSHSHGKTCLLDEKEGPLFDDIKCIIFLPWAHHLIYVARRQSKECVVIDNRDEGQYFDAVTLSGTYDDTGGYFYLYNQADSFHYTARQGLTHYLIEEEIES